MAKSETLREMLIVKLQALYDIETELTEALPRMAAAAMEPGLKEAFKSHCDETRGQMQRLDSAFSILGEKRQKTKVEGVRGMVKDAEWLAKNTTEGVPLDTALIGAARAVEAYETSLYSSAQEWAEKLENQQLATLLKESAAEEANAGMKLGNLSAQIISRIKVN